MQLLHLALPDRDQRLPGSSAAAAGTARRSQDPEMSSSQFEDGGTDFFERQREHRATLDPERHLLGQEIQTRLAAAMERLSPRERIVFEIKHSQGLKLRAIGDALGTSEETVKNSLFRATRKLRSELGVFEMSAGDPKNACSEIGALLVFYVCDEVNAQERAVIEQHLSVCSGCKALLEEELLLSRNPGIHSFPQQTVSMLPAFCYLSAAVRLPKLLDDLEKPAIKEKVPAFGWLRGWMLLHPAWSAATLLLFGLIGGAQYAQWETAAERSNGSGSCL